MNTKLLELNKVLTQLKFHRSNAFTHSTIALFDKAIKKVEAEIGELK